MDIIIKKKTKRQRWIYHQVAEFSSVVGIRTPEVEIVGIDEDANLPARRYSYFRTYLGQADIDKHTMILRPEKGESLHSLRRIIAHEVIHFAFPALSHGATFER